MFATRIKEFGALIHRWRYLIIFLFVVFGACAVVGGRWAYGKFVNRQANALVAKATEDLRRGNATQARMGVETALRLKPGHPSATRLLARVQAATGEPEKALATFQKLGDESQLSLEDIKLYSSLALRKGEDELAGRLADFAGAHGDPAFPHLLESSMQLRDKKPAEAEAALRAAVQADAGDNTRAILLDFLLANRKPGQSVTEIAAIIEDFSTRENAFGAQALALGLRTGFMNPDKRGEWIEKLRTHPQATIQHRILAESAALAMDPKSKPEVAARLVEFSKPRPLPDRAAAAQWLAANGFPSEALSILPLEESLQHPGTFIVWLDANAVVQNWSGCLEALSRPENPLPSHHANLFRGLALRELGRSAESEAAFRDSIREAGDDPEAFAFVLAYLFGANESKLFEENLATLPDQPQLPAIAAASYRLLYPSVKQRRDAELSLRVLESLSAAIAITRNPAFQNELAHQRILLGKPAPLDFLRNHSEKNPDDLATLTTLAFHQLKNGDPAGAMALFDGYGPDVDARSLPPRILCIFSATLAANGKTDLARKVASIIPRASLSTQEAEFLSARLQPAN